MGGLSTGVLLALCLVDAAISGPCPILQSQDSWAVVLPHRFNCSAFYICSWGVAVQMSCPPGLHFNPALQVCDWPSAAGCRAEKTTLHAEAAGALLIRPSAASAVLQTGTVGGQHSPQPNLPAVVGTTETTTVLNANLSTSSGVTTTQVATRRPKTSTGTTEIPEHSVHTDTTLTFSTVTATQLTAVSQSTTQATSELTKSTTVSTSTPSTTTIFTTSHIPAEARTTSPADTEIPRSTTISTNNPSLISTTSTVQVTTEPEVTTRKTTVLLNSPSVHTENPGTVSTVT